MKKTTIYLPDDLKDRLETIAQSEGRTVAELIRDAIATAVAARRPPHPRVPLPGMTLGDPSVAERAGELMEGFGE